MIGEAGAGEEGESAEREEGCDQAEGGSAAQEGESEDDAAEGTDHPWPLQDFA